MWFLYFLFFGVSFTLIGVGVYQIYVNHQTKIEEQRRIETARKEEEHRKEREKREEEERKQQRKQAMIARNNMLLKKKASFAQLLDSLPKYDISLSDEKHNRNATLYVECKNMTKSTPINKIKDFVAVDVETTGLKAHGNDIIQLSAVKFANFEPVELFSTYTKPRKNIPKEASDINGITDDMVENAPHFYQIIDSFNKFIGDLPLIAHNAPFDMKHLYVNGLDSIENKTVYDTLDLSKKIIKGAYSYKLQDICEEADIYFNNAHSADVDSLAAGLLFVYLCAERKELTVKDMIDMVK